MRRRVVILALTLLSFMGIGVGYLLLRRPQPPMIAETIDKWELQMLRPDGEVNRGSFDEPQAAPVGGSNKPAIIRIDRAHPYVRQLTITDPNTFEIPGVYKVQLRYDFDAPFRQPPPAPTGVSSKDPEARRVFRRVRRPRFHG